MRAILKVIVLTLAAGIFFYAILASVSRVSFFAQSPDQFHYAASSQAEFYNQAYLAQAPKGASEKISEVKAVIVNHHLLAPRLIANALEVVSTNKDLTVVLLSPNHFSVGKSQTITSLYSWKTPFGLLSPDKNLIRRLLNSGQAAVEEKPFEQEHGVTNLVGFLKKSLPAATLAPLILKDTMTQKQAQELGEGLARLLPPDALIVASLDFSHYLPESAATFHDRRSTEVLQHFDIGAVNSVELDSKPVLHTLFSYLKAVGAEKFTLLAQDNSASIAQKPELNETTGYVTGYFEQGVSAATSTDVFLLNGGVMSVGEQSDWLNPYKQTFAFGKMRRLFDGNDLTGVFLEAPSGQELVSDSFRQFVTDLGFNLLLGGKALSSEVYPAPRECTLCQAGGESSPASERSDKCSMPPAHAKWCGVYEGNFRGNNVVNLWFSQDSPKSFPLASVAAAAQKPGFVQVYYGAHGMSLSKLRVAAHDLVDAGADAVFFTGRKALGPLEIYGNGIIVYGFGDSFQSPKSQTENKTGFAVGIESGRGELAYYFFPWRQEKGKFFLLSGPDSAIMLQNLGNVSFLTKEQKSQMQTAIIRIDR